MSKMFSFVVLLFFVLQASFFGQQNTFVDAKDQTIHVTGQVTCGRRSMANVIVELREKDTVDPDDSLNSTHTDRAGFFDLFGHEDEVGMIKPYLRIVHNCDVAQKGINIPQSKVDKHFDMEFVNMKIPGHSDEEKCDT